MCLRRKTREKTSTEGQWTLPQLTEEQLQFSGPMQTGLGLPIGENAQFHAKENHQIMNNALLGESPLWEQMKRFVWIVLSKYLPGLVILKIRLMNAPKRHSEFSLCVGRDKLHPW